MSKLRCEIFHDNLQDTESKYLEFLRGKIERAPVSGFEISREEINDALLPHQKDAVAWAMHASAACLLGLAEHIRKAVEG